MVLIDDNASLDEMPMQREEGNVSMMITTGLSNEIK